MWNLVYSKCTCGSVNNLGTLFDRILTKGHKIYCIFVPKEKNMELFNWHLFKVNFVWNKTLHTVSHQFLVGCFVCFHSFGRVRARPLFAATFRSHAPVQLLCCYLHSVSWSDLWFPRQRLFSTLNCILKRTENLS